MLHLLDVYCPHADGVGIVTNSYLYYRKGSPYIYYGWKDERGRKHGESLKTTDPTEANILRGERDKKLFHGQDPKTSKITWAAWREQYEQTAKAHKKLSAYKRDVTALNAFEAILRPQEAPLSAIQKAHIDRFMRERALSASKATANIDFGTLHSFFNRAMEHEYILKNPCQYVGKYPLPMRSRIPFTHAETEAIIQEAKRHGNQDLTDMMMTFLYTGIRLDELCHLVKPYVDTDAMTYKIEAWESHEMDWPRDWRPAKFSPKRCQIRINPLDPKLQPIVGRRIKQVDGPLLFPGRNGVRSKFCVEELFERLLKRAGIEGKTIHNFRHTWITRALESGGDIATVSRMAGHADVKTTMIYFTAEMRRKWEVQVKYRPRG